jgi:hypothetical protein
VSREALERQLGSNECLDDGAGSGGEDSRSAGHNDNQSGSFWPRPTAGTCTTEETGSVVELFLEKPKPCHARPLVAHSNGLVWPAPATKISVKAENKICRLNAEIAV